MMTDVQAEFLDIVNYFNETIMTNKLVVNSRLQRKFNKSVHQTTAACAAAATTTGDEGGGGEPSPPWSNDYFYTYIFRKNKDIQNDLFIYNRKLTYFYLYNKKVYEVFSVVLIVLSSSLTLIEGIALCFDPVVHTTIVTLVISMTIGVLTSVLKFFNFKNETEDIIKIKEKVNMCSTKIFTFDKKLKSQLYLKYNDVVPPELLDEDENNIPE